MNVIIFDFEVFSHNTLLGAYVCNEREETLFQSWDLAECKRFFLEHQNDFWIGWNNHHYDNFILEAVVSDKTAEQIKRVSDEIVREGKKKFLKLRLLSFDLMSQSREYLSLKVTECGRGKKVHESDVDFDIGRHLTDKEKQNVQSYNLSDLKQTKYEFFETWRKNDFELKLYIVDMFKLNPEAIAYTSTRLAEEVLHAEKIDGIENMLVKPKIFDTLQVKNQAVLDFYLNEKFRTSEKLDVMLCGTMHRIGSGGIHGAQSRVHYDNALYFDVSGYYNLIMINLDLLPRSIPPESKKLYEWMYHEQLRLKKIDPFKRTAYKVILLSVFGAMMNKYCRFYDPQHGLLVTIAGQLYIVDLAEKLEGIATIVQSNTDGVIVIPNEGHSEEEIREIVDEWQTRTGFVLKIEHITNLHQRDVNNYCYVDADGKTHAIGEAVRSRWSSKDAEIVQTAVVEYLINKKLPEETIAEKADELLLFQNICKKQSCDWLQYENDGEVTLMQNVNRIFAEADGGTVYKCKRNGSKSKIAGLPEHCMIYNEEILSENVVLDLMQRIDYNYYIERAYAKILAFYKIDEIKEVHIGGNV